MFQTRRGSTLPPDSSPPCVNDSGNAATVRASGLSVVPATVRNLSGNIERGKPWRPCASCHHRTPQPVRQPFDRGKHRTRQTCRRIRRQSIRQPFDRGATYPATVCQLPPSNAATYPATLNAATVRNRSRRIPANVSRDRAPPVSHSAAVPSH